MPHSAYAHERVHVWNLRMSEALHYIWHVICKCILLVFDNWVWHRCHIWRFVDKSNFQVNAQLIIMNHLYFLCVYLYWVLQRRYILEFVDKSKTIDVFSSADFQKLRNFQLNCKFRGITCFEGNLYVACVTHILKLDQMGHRLQTYNVDGNNILHVITTRRGLIVYTDWRLETVTAIDDKGRGVWIYKSCDLKQPMELDVDSYDNIYIAGYISNNIHVLSNSGKLIRVIENIPNPTFCKINEYEGIMCVCSGLRKINLYQLQPNK